MSAASVLPFVWAVGDSFDAAPLAPHTGFYRKYTEALLRRYLRLSMEAGKVPSLLGQEMFRGKVTSYRVTNFDDVVIFVHDVEHCLERLDAGQQDLIARLALQQYTINETAQLTGTPARTIARHYTRALDALTRIFFAAGMLEAQAASAPAPRQRCQGGKN